MAQTAAEQLIEASPSRFDWLRNIDLREIRRFAGVMSAAACFAISGVGKSQGAEASAGKIGVGTDPVVTAERGAITINGQPTFLIGAGWLSAENVPEALGLGIKVFQSNNPYSSQESIAAVVGDQGFVVPDYSPENLAAGFSNTLGYSLPDEADGHNILPPSIDQDPKKRYLPRTKRVAETGKLIFQTITAHYLTGQAKFDGIDMQTYQAYAANADVLLTDVYPKAHSCEVPGLNVLSTVYDAMVQFKQLAGEKPVGEWIETGPITGVCGIDPVSPVTARAEAWAAVAGGATSIFWFTHTWAEGSWSQFDVTEEMAASIKNTNEEFEKYSKILLAPQTAGVISTPNDPIKVGVRTFNGRPYLIAVNLSDTEVSLASDYYARWQTRLPGISGQTISEITSGRAVQAKNSKFDDTFQPLDVHIYSWKLQPSRVKAKPSQPPKKTKKAVTLLRHR